MENSQLTIQVIEAEDLRTTESNGGSQIEPYVILAVEGQKIETS